ncbi:MAG: sorbosone dehydrogenase family protein [Chitinophagaceae bacterium]|nr:sorbosone dehydrogenase family protein [Chitinophagaceae bacterium]
MLYKKTAFFFLFFISSHFMVKCQPDDLFKKYDLDKIQLPPGFSISVYAEVPNARSMCWGQKGTLFVGNRSKDKVYAVTDADKDGIADTVFVIDKGLNMPNGVAFRKGSLYVAEVNRILRYDDIENRLGNPPKPVVVNDRLPADKHHGWKFIAFGPDDKLYVPVGAPCNICEKENKIYASIARMNPDGSGLEVYASGIRNTVGFAWHPQTKELWFTENGRDMMGDDMPADELNHAPEMGMHFGYPYCHQGDTPDPEFGANRNCTEFTAPAQKLMPHTAALGMRFYTGNMFLPEYKNQVFIAEHGSWNRSEKSGYRVMLVRLEKNKAVQYIPFATGWLSNNGKVSGRPVDIEIAADGAMLVSDDQRGAIYRIVFNN